jgi:hypothetical protein
LAALSGKIRERNAVFTLGQYLLEDFEWSHEDASFFRDYLVLGYVFKQLFKGKNCVC